MVHGQSRMPSKSITSWAFAIIMLLMPSGTGGDAKAQAYDANGCAKPPSSSCVSTEGRWDDEDGDGNDDTYVSYFINNCGTRILLKMCNQRRRQELTWGCEITSLRAGQTKFLRTWGGATGETKWAYLASRDATSDDICRKGLRDE
jgi:hypothetical protein